MSNLFYKTLDQRLEAWTLEFLDVIRLRYRPVLKIHLFLIFLGLVVLGPQIFTPILVDDSWYRILPFGAGAAVPTGRWMKPIIWYLGGGAREAYGLSALVLVTVGSLACIAIARLFSLEKPLSIAIFSILLFFNPIFASHHALYSHHLSTAVSMSCVAIYLFFLRRIIDSALPARIRSRDLVAAGIFFTLATANRQEYALVAVCLTWGLILRDYSVGALPFLRLAKLISIATGISVAAFGAYLVSWKLSLALTGLKTHIRGGYALEGSFIQGFSDLKWTLYRACGYLLTFLFGEQYLWPIQVKVAFLVLLVIFATLLFQTQDRKRPSLAQIVGYGAIILLIFLTPFAFGIFRKTGNTYRLTGLLGLAPIYSIFFCVCLQLISAPKKTLEVLVYGVGIICSVAFLAKQNLAYQSMHFIYNLDRSWASRILGRIEALPEVHRNWKPGKPIRIITLGVGAESANKGFFSNTTAGLMASGIPDSSVYLHQPQKLQHLLATVDFDYKEALVKYYRPYHYFECSDGDKRQLKEDLPLLISLKQEEKVALINQIAAAKPWPHRESIVFAGNTVFLVLSKSRGETKKLHCLLL